MQHFGLYFTSEHVQQAHRAADQFQPAWNLLRTYFPTDLLTGAQINGLRYRLDDDEAAGQNGLDLLRQLGMSISESDFDSLTTAVALAQCYELVRDFDSQSGWLDSFAAHVEQLNQKVSEPSFVEHLWLNLLNLSAGIVLERDDRFRQAVEVFKEAIRHDVHPEGYIPKVVQSQAGHGLYLMLLAAQALILTAEAATHAGENLWAFEHRSVSVLTPTPYLLYYYYYPEKWRWDTTLQTEEVQALYKRHAGFWEMAQRHSPSRDRKILLDELRPIYDVRGGGLTTLTHGAETLPRRRGFFL